MGAGAIKHQHAILDHDQGRIDLIGGAAIHAINTDDRHFKLLCYFSAITTLQLQPPPLRKKNVNLPYIVQFSVFSAGNIIH
jgi:hypothetical protein